ncbi:MAG: hypothetical protein WBJ13_09915, partial [Sedimentibacter sp.]
EFIPVINENDFETIQKLSIFLRITEELCKIQNGNIKELQCKINKNNIKIIQVKQISTSENLFTSLQSEKDFKKVFNKNLIIE